MLDCKALSLLRWDKGKFRDRFGLKVFKAIWVVTVIIHVNPEIKYICKTM